MRSVQPERSTTARPSVRTAGASSRRAHTGGRSGPVRTSTAATARSSSMRASARAPWAPSTAPGSSGIRRAPAVGEKPTLLALKQLKPQASIQPELRAFFQNEAEALQLLAHPERRALPRALHVDARRSPARRPRPEQRGAVGRASVGRALADPRDGVRRRRHPRGRRRPQRGARTARRERRAARARAAARLVLLPAAARRARRDARARHRAS